MDEKERHSLRQELQRGLSELRNCFDELHKDLEWAGLTESYNAASAVYRKIEGLEDIVKRM